MGFGLATFVPATAGTDELLIVGFEGLDAICIDQDGDLRVLSLTDIKTKWLYIKEPGVWFNNQAELEEYEEEPGPELPPAPYIP
jgi:hypothetical protein